ncbi:MAG: TIR domain-containing protein, partial [Anaerolineae bacterium]|nr:TIR domain-containing protein [Anaerolineae bacterium]
MKVLISYAPGDRSFAYTLPVIFARDEVVLEPHSPETARAARMRAAIESCDRLVAVLSPRYLDSRACEAEWRYALSLGKALSGLHVEHCTPPPEFAAAAEILDVSGAWLGYLGALSSAVAGPRGGAPAAPAPAQPASKAPPTEPSHDAGRALLTRLAGALAVGGDEAALAVLGDPAARNAPELAGGRRRWLESNVQALRKGDRLKGLEALDFLAGVESIAPRDRAALLVRAGRLRLNQGDRSGSLADFRRAESLDGRAAPIRAALGEYYRRQGDTGRAAEHFNAAPDQPPALIGLGLLAEANGDWTRADTYYAEAVALLASAPGPGDLLTRLEPDRLGVEATGNLYLEAARVLRRERPPDALRAVEIALEKGVKDDTAYPERVPLRLKAELLEALGRPAEAAEAFFEAGKRFNWLNQHLLALDMLEAAHRLRPDHAEMCWYLANSLLMTSYTQEPPYYREEPLRRSMAVWEQGIALALPDAEQSWIYTLRAFQLEMAAAIPDADRIGLYWEAAALIERAIALDPDEVNRWHILGRTHRNLLNEAASMQAVRRSIDLAPDNPTVLEEAVIVLTNAAEFDEVAPLIDRYAEYAPEAGWATAVRAFVALRRDDAMTALRLTEQAFEQVTEANRQPWFYELRADVYRKLGQPERAIEDYRWLWDHRDDPRFPTSAASFGWAAFYLGLPADAIPYLERGLQESTERPAAVYIARGLCHFALGETARGEANLMDGIAQMVNGREVGQFLDLDYPDAVRFSQSWPDGEAARAALDRARQTVLDRRAEIEAPDSPLDELEMHRRDTAADPASWRHIAATAGLARLYTDAQRFAEALACIRELQAQPDRFPEAPARLDRWLRS